MSEYFGNWIKETTATVGTGTLTLAGETGFTRFADEFIVGKSVIYTIEDGNNREVGIGTVGAANTLVRTTPHATLASGVFDDSSPTAISLSGSAIVYGTASAESLSSSYLATLFLANSTYSTVQDNLNINHSAGLVDGADITDDADGTITVAAGNGILRATDSDTAGIYHTTWAEESGAGVGLVDEDLNHIYVEWNAGVPQVVATNVHRTDTNTNIHLGTVYREGTELHITTASKFIIADHAGKMNQRNQELAPFAHVAGSAISETGTRNLVVTAGQYWHGFTRYLTGAKDTSASDVVAIFYRDGIGGWTENAVGTQIDNLNYDDGSGTLAALGSSKYGVHWIYLGQDGHIYSIYGRGSYSATDAADAEQPADLPPNFEKHARIIGRIIIEKSSATFHSIESAFGHLFAPGGLSDHGALTGLTDDDHTNYLLADGTRVALTFSFTNALQRSTATLNGTATDGHVNLGNGTSITGTAAQAYDSATVGGGENNSATFAHATTCGGKDNGAIGAYAAVGGGRLNFAGQNGVTAGGYNNANAGVTGTISGGGYNVISAAGTNSFIGGGYGGDVTGAYSVIGGGRYNQVLLADYATIGGGGGATAPEANEISADESTIGGGTNNTISTIRSTISGGRGNNIDTQTTGVIAGGQLNTCQSFGGFIGGGASHLVASGNYASILGGNTNYVSGAQGSVIGGKGNRAQHVSSIACGGGSNTRADYDLVLGATDTTTWAVANNTIRLQGTGGNVLIDGSVSSPEADYAELFEWADGNPNNEDRVGLFVSVIAGKMELGDNPLSNVKGVISGAPAIIGNAAANHWSQMYLTDKWKRPSFTTYIRHEWEETVVSALAIAEVTGVPYSAAILEVLDDEGAILIEAVAEVLEVEYIPARVEQTETTKYSAYESELGTLFDEYPQPTNVTGTISAKVMPEVTEATAVQVRTINPSFDITQEYIPRIERPEWDPVGLLGQLLTVTNELITGTKVDFAEDGGAINGTLYDVLDVVDSTQALVFIK